MNEYQAMEQAFKNGYKKAAEEIFAELEEKLKEINRLNIKGCELDFGKVMFYLFYTSDFDEIKKKYTEGNV